MAAADPRTKQLKIQTGVVKRITKETAAYAKEAVDLQLKVDQMKAKNEDEYVIRKQEEVVAESKMMGPDCERRLKTAWDNLEKLLNQSQEELSETEEFKNASAALEESKKAIEESKK